MSAKITFYGNLTKDPVFNKYNNQDCLRLAVANRTTRKQEDGTYITNFYDVTIWGQRAAYLSDKIEKGTMVFVSGEFYAMEYMSKQTNEKKVSLQVAADSVEPIARMKGQQNSNAGGNASSRRNTNTNTQSTVVEDDDEMPF